MNQSSSIDQTRRISIGRPDARRKAIRHLEKILEEQTKSDEEDIF